MALPDVVVIQNDKIQNLMTLENITGESGVERTIQ